MHLVAQYRQFAIDCRRLAATLSKSADKQVHSDDAGTWLLSTPPTPRRRGWRLPLRQSQVIALAVFAPRQPDLPAQGRGNPAACRL